MMRTVAALLAANLATQFLLPAVCAPARAAESQVAGSAAADSSAPAVSRDPFERVPLTVRPRCSHRLAWTSLVAGASLVGLSFGLTDRANDTYADYLLATDPARAEHLYDRTRHYDRLSAVSLLTGEALVATAVWLRFIHDRPASRLRVAAGPDRCAVSLRF
jgi:hypothetical protein